MVNITYTAQPDICEKGGSGVFLPLSSSEHELNDSVRSILYLALLFYTFMGVNFASDYFMLAIETITSKKKRVWNSKIARNQTILAWNATVANLTLMALGSSAPEILLNCIETMLSNEFYSGSLGPSVIVGSAAFNLLVIIAVCISSIPSPETRHISVMAVYHITALFSMFAYVWLQLIVVSISPDVVDLWEAVITLLMCPVLVVLSFLADKGHLNFMAFEKVEDEPDLSGRSSQAQRRSYIKSQEISTENDVSNGGFQQGAEHPRVRSARKSHRNSANLLAHGDGHGHHDVNHKVQKAKQAHPAIAKMDHPGKRGPAGLETKIDVTRGELEDCKDLEGNRILNDNGILRFQTDDDLVEGLNEPVEFKAVVHRSNGCLGEISCNYHTEGITALPGYDFEDVTGTMEMADGVIEKEITLTILPKQIGERADQFQLILEEAEGGAIFNPLDDGGTDRAVLTLTIINGNKETAKGAGKLLSCLRAIVDMDNFNMGLAVWKMQIIESINFDDDEEDEEEGQDAQEPEARPPKSRSVMDYIFYVLNLPWKIGFALASPPPNWGGGWVLFICELGLIGLLTAFVADLAGLFGCCAGFEPEATAITVVALGTSLPDTFASVSAAQGDEYADASIVNVTGSNSVNVFLGIGMPWTLAAIYWMNPGDEVHTWRLRHIHLPKVLSDYPDGAFVVEAGTLSFSVAVFCSMCLIALSVLRVRRLAFGGELGGPANTKFASSATLLGCWATYIISSIWRSKSEDAEVLKIPLASLGCLVVLCAIGYEIMLRKNGSIEAPSSQEQSPAALEQSSEVANDAQEQASNEPPSNMVGKTTEEALSGNDVAVTVSPPEEVQPDVKDEQDNNAKATAGSANDPPKAKKPKPEAPGKNTPTETAQANTETPPELAPELVVPDPPDQSSEPVSKKKTKVSQDKQSDGASSKKVSKQAGGQAKPKSAAAKTEPKPKKKQSMEAID